MSFETIMKAQGCHINFEIYHKKLDLFPLNIYTIIVLVKWVDWRVNPDYPNFNVQFLICFFMATGEIFFSFGGLDFINLPK